MGKHIGLIVFMLIVGVAYLATAAWIISLIAPNNLGR